MSMLQHGLSEDNGYTVNQSLRTRRGGYLSRTFGTPTNDKKYTYSHWFKRGSFTGANQVLFSAVSATDALYFYEPTQTLSIQAASQVLRRSNAVYRDITGHCHIQMVVDTANATASERLKLYYNGLEITSWAINVTITQNYVFGFGAAVAHVICEYIEGLGTFGADGYNSEINFIDGQALDPSAFGQMDAATGIWVPKKYTGTYGNNGFYLPFNDATSLTTLGYDRSGNGNNWTCNGISITAGATYDVMKDSPTNGLNEVGNYATLNPLSKNPSLTTSTCTNGNLDASASAANTLCKATTPLPLAGSWYAEATINATGAIFGLGENLVNNFGVNSSTLGSRTFYLYNATSQVYTILPGAETVITSVLPAGSKFVFAYDASTLKLWLGYAANGAGSITWVGGGNPATGTSPTYTLGASAELFPLVGTNGGIVSVNFGQRPFAYTPPTGFKPLHTGNLPVPTVKNGSEHFQVKLDTGPNIKTACEALFTNELEWIKDRANANNHQLIDSVRGSNSVLQSNTTAAETTYVAPSGSSVGWVWRASDSAPVTNTDGSITSTVSANVAAGFSVVTYTGTGANATVGHGLGVAPKMVIVKNRQGGAENWNTWHIGLTNATYRVCLNLTGAQDVSTTFWNSTAPNSSIISLGSFAGTNQSGLLHVAYCFSEIPGYSKFGSYVGNGSTDGPFVYCGFTPKYILIKCSSTSGNWYIFDIVRNTYNVLGEQLYPNLSNLGSTVTTVDVLSNGFKLRLTGDPNAAQTYVFAAFAESPFALNNRAR